MWERYCELRMVGVEVMGVLLPGLRQVCMENLVVGGDLRLHRVPDWYQDDRLEFSMRKLLDFWSAVGALYDG